MTNLQAMKLLDPCDKLYVINGERPMEIDRFILFGYYIFILDQ